MVTYRITAIETITENFTLQVLVGEIFIDEILIATGLRARILI